MVYVDLLRMYVVQWHRCWILAVVRWHLTTVILAAAAVTHCAVRQVVERTVTLRRASWKSRRRVKKTAS